MVSKKCPVCKGHGETNLKYTQVLLGTDETEQVDKYERCYYCKGTGSIEE